MTGLKRIPSCLPSACSKPDRWLSSPLVSSSLPSGESHCAGLTWLSLRSGLHFVSPSATSSSGEWSYLSSTDLISCLAILKAVCTPWPCSCTSTTALPRSGNWSSLVKRGWLASHQTAFLSFLSNRLSFHYLACGLQLNEILILSSSSATESAILCWSLLLRERNSNWLLSVSWISCIDWYVWPY